MKLEGRDPDPGRRATVQEQVSELENLINFIQIILLLRA